jgi:hypothetical protein
MIVLAELVRPRQFLLLGGTVLVILGLAGVTGLLGSFLQASLFNPPYWINWVHLTLGIVVLSIAFGGGRTFQSAMTLAAGALGSTLGFSGLLFGSYAAKRYNIPELADPSDHLAHLTLGVLAFWAWSNRKAGHQLSV